MAEVQENLSQTMEQMAKEVNLAMKTLKEGTLPTTTMMMMMTDSSNSGGESNAETG